MFIYMDETWFFMLEEWIYDEDALKMYQGEYFGSFE